MIKILSYYLSTNHHYDPIFLILNEQKFVSGRNFLIPSNDHALSPIKMLINLH